MLRSQTVPLAHTKMWLKTILCEYFLFCFLSACTRSDLCLINFVYRICLACKD